MCVPFTQFPPVVSSCKTSKESPPGCLIQSRYRMFPSPHTPSCCHVTQPHLLPSPRPFYLWQPPVSFRCYKLVIWIVLYKWNHTGYNLFSSVAQSCPTLQLLEPHSTPGLPVHHQLPESTQTHVHWVGDAIERSHPLSPSPPALNLSQHQGLFQWISSSRQVAKVLEFQLEHQSFQWTPRTDLL